MKHTILGQFLAKPLSTGAVCSSSPGLSKLIVTDMGLESAKSVVELGPGTGAVTNFIIDNLAPGTAFFTVELNQDMYTAFTRKFPNIKTYNDCASNLPAIVHKEGLDKVDVVLSGLPWASFSEDSQEEILSAVVEALPKGGLFATFAYLQGAILPTGQSFRKRLHRHFSSVEKTQVVWLNVPPAFVYRCRK
jgi:phosphatidylethanolamine/phosphatidyl-N-methylethanolamine N-methyltransferase